MRKIWYLIKKYVYEEKNLMINISAAFVIRGLSLIISTFSLPLYINYFDNNDVLGIWYTILSILTWINICDFGLGNGLRNKLTEALARQDFNLAKKYVSSTYLLLMIIIIPILGVLYYLISITDFNAFLKISENIVSEEALRKTIYILAFSIGIHFILKLINSIIYALQISSVNNILALLSSIIPLIFILIYDGATIEENLLALSKVHLFSMNIPLLIVSIIIFIKNNKICPSVNSLDVISAKSTIGLGVKFFIAQLFFMVLISTNEVFISSLYSPNSVVTYNVYYKLFMVVGSLFMIILTPIWSKVTKDITEKQYYKLQTTNKLLYSLSSIAILAEFMLIPCLQWIINIWLGSNAIDVNIRVAIVFAIFGSLYIVNIVLTTIANGIGEIKSQIFFYGLGAFLKIPTCIILSLVGVDWHGIVLYNSIVLLIFSIYQFVWIERRIKSLIKAM